MKRMETPPHTHTHTHTRVFYLPPVSRGLIESLRTSANLRRLTVWWWLAE